MTSKKLIIKNEGKKILSKQLNTLALSRLKSKVISPKNVQGYIDGINDVYMELTDSDKPMTFSKEVLILLDINNSLKLK